MKSSNTELVAQLEEAIAGLLFPTENSYRFKTFVWEVAEQGSTLEKILQSAGIVKYVKIDDFLQFISSVELITSESKNKYVKLFHKLQTSLKNIEILRISISDETDDLGEYETFYLIIGKTQAGDWIGISPKIDACSARRSEILPLDSSTLVKENTLAQVTEIENILAGLEFPVVQYYVKDKIEEYIIEIAENRELVIDKILHSLEVVKTCAFKNFSDYYSPIRDDEEVDFEKVKHLDQILQSNLTNLREYVIGGMAIYYLYDIGQTQDGDWIGVSTIAIWT